MDLCYICAKGSRPEHLINARSSPEIEDGNIINKVYTTGVKARILPYVSKDAQGYFWSKYQLAHNNQDVWLRDDVYNKFVFGERKILEVEYVGQNDTGSDFSSNDCGIATTLMAMKYGGFIQAKSVNELAKEAGMDGDDKTLFKHIIFLLNKYNFKPVFKRPMLLTDVLEKVKNNIPVICLINYNQLFSDKFFAHFVVVCGYDQEFVYCQDPFNLVKYVGYTHLKFSRALANVGNMWNNSPYQGLYINYTEEQLQSKETNILKRLDVLEAEVKMLIQEVAKLKGVA